MHVKLAVGRCGHVPAPDIISARRRERHGFMLNQVATALRRSCRVFPLATSIPMNKPHLRATQRWTSLALLVVAIILLVIVASIGLVSLTYDDLVLLVTVVLQRRQLEHGTRQLEQSTRAFDLEAFVRVHDTMNLPEGLAARGRLQALAQRRDNPPVPFDPNLFVNRCYGCLPP